MVASLKRLFPRIFVFWGLHLVMAVAGPVAIALEGPFQSRGLSELGSQVSLVASILLVMLYAYIMARAARKRLTSMGEGLLFSIAGSLPMFATILIAVSYLKKVPYNTIGYNFILLWVTAPFQGLMEYIFPRYPFHLMALSVPLVFIAAILAGTRPQTRGRQTV